MKKKFLLLAFVLGGFTAGAQIILDPVPFDPCDLKLDNSGNAPDPRWFSGMNKLYTSCPMVQVGIKTSEPKYDLDVRGSSYSLRLGLGVHTGDPIPSIFYLKAPYPLNYSTNIFVVENTNRKLFQINNNGLVQAREIKIDMTNWPDYVFEKEYKLPSLAQVEAHIQQYGHLPSVPSAKTIESEGVNLGEMDKILMRKIEELTLYILEQDKRIKSLEAEIHSNK